MDYSRFISKKAEEIKPSGIRKYFDVAHEFNDALSLGVGEPDFATPFNVATAGIRSINTGRTQYTSNAGLVSLRENIVRFVAERYGVNYSVDETIVTVGASEGIDLAMRAILEPLDEVLIPDPCYVSYSPCVTLCGGVAVPVVCKVEHEFKLTAEALNNALTPKTKVLVLPYPNNPTGAIMTREELQVVADFVEKNNLIVVSDEIYGELTYEGKHCSFASLDGMRERTILINGFSKAFAMTGWRLGYLCAPKPLHDIMLKIHQYVLMCAPTASQYAGLEALKSGFEDDFSAISEMREKYDQRRRFLVASLNDMGLKCFNPLGAFYAFPSVISTGLNGDEFTEQLLKSQHVAVVHGSAFGDSGINHIRISYAYSIDKISKALERIKAFLASL